ncbi:MAG: DUF4192 domain-containing protein [Micropruina sp.]
MTTYGSSQRLAVRGLEEMLGVLPHVMGFHPEESLVAILLEHNDVVLTARVDLTCVADPGEAEQHITRMTSRFPGARVCLIAYTEDPALGWEVLAECEMTAGLATVCTLLVTGGWWFDHPCGPGEPYDPRASIAAAEATLRGMPARPSRADLAALVRGPSDPAGQRASFTTQLKWLDDVLDPAQERSFLVRLLQEAIARPTDLSDEDVARLALLVRSPDPRDQASMMLCRKTAPALLAVWSTVVSRTPPEFALQPLALMGMAAWVAGEGALSVCCLERAETLAPRAGLVAILSDTNSLMLAPDYWDEVLRPDFLTVARLVKAMPRRAYRRMIQRRR